MSISLGTFTLGLDHHTAEQHLLRAPAGRDGVVRGPAGQGRSFRILRTS